MNGDKFQTAGWLAIAMAVLSIPSFIMDFLSGWQFLAKVLGIVSTVLYIYVYLRFKDVLNDLYEFYDVDTYILIFIWTAVIFGIINLFRSPSLSPMPSDGLGILAFIVLFAFVIITIVFNIKLFHLQDAYGIKPYVYTGIAGAICMATIILFPIALVLSVVQDVILAMIFFRAAKEAPVSY